MKQLPKKIQVLLIMQLPFNIGFYLVVPFVAVELLNNLGASGAMAGLVFGVRISSQQGVFFLGGGLVDRLGVIKVLLVGVALRVVGFLITGSATPVPMMFIDAVLIGFATALFSPVIEPLLAGGGAELEKQGAVSYTRF